MVVDSCKPIFHLYANINTRLQKIIGINYPTHTNVKYPDKPPCTPEIIGRAPGEKVKGVVGKREAKLVRQRIVECPVAFAR
eukprot:scaffold34051_cov124-Isochrysis_galbana.AAC.3